MLSDAIKFQFDAIHHATSQHPQHFLTLASLSLNAFLYAVKCPTDPSKPIFLEFLEERVDGLMTGDLMGVSLRYTLIKCL